MVKAKSKRETTTPSVPKVATAACHGFFESWATINAFYNFLLNLVAHIERVATISHEVLVDTAHDDDEKQRLLDNWAERESAVAMLKSHRQFLMEVVLVRHLENYLAFLASLLSEIFITRPETLRSAEKIAVEDVLRHGSIEELIRDLSERKVNSLTYLSLQDLAEYFDTKLGLELIGHAHIQHLIEAAEIRNISVHNRCIVNERFIERTGLQTLKVGAKFQLYVDRIDELIPILAEEARSLDQRARAHLGLKAIRQPVAT